MSEWLTEAVLRVAETIPAGSVASYGDLALALGVGPRQVGQVMSLSGSSVPWWRVIRADGTLPDALLDEARAHWHEEGVALRSDGTGVQMRLCRLDRGLLEQLVAEAVAGLEP
mgnify:CR=1 FL=1